MNKKKHLWNYLFIITIVLFVMFIGGWIGVRQVIYELTATPLRKALPADAQDIHEWSWDEEGETPQDYCYLLKAKITPEEFQQYVNGLNLTPHTSTRRYFYGFSPNWSMSWRIKDKGLDWWTPSDDLSNTYIYDGGTAWVYAKYEGGYVFAVSYNI